MNHNELVIIVGWIFTIIGFAGTLLSLKFGLFGLAYMLLTLPLLLVGFLFWCWAAHSKKKEQAIECFKSKSIFNFKVLWKTVFGIICFLIVVWIAILALNEFGYSYDTNSNGLEPVGSYLLGYALIQTPFIIIFTIFALYLKKLSKKIYG
ncbi:hypothetical protein [Methanolapillus millepedarum]|uniref:Uncharacterized protein n=1 Tax=Methanolapillus millepedarum TaxID=3028296 RepID=A0AA96V5G9_9EURY|nr:hypothetical protein MsAc7_14700 [Methanosarcinaceae archaeon Ac7]